MRIRIDPKYLYINDDKGNQIAYFEEFECKEEKRNVIKLSCEDKQGNKFLKENNYLIQNADVYWFSKKPLKYRVMFVEEKIGASSYLILITPALLKLKRYPPLPTITSRKAD